MLVGGCLATVFLTAEAAVFLADAFVAGAGGVTVFMVFFILRFRLVRALTAKISFCLAPEMFNSNLKANPLSL